MILGIAMNSGLEVAFVSHRAPCMFDRQGLYVLCRLVCISWLLFLDTINIFLVFISFG